MVVISLSRKLWSDKIWKKIVRGNGISWLALCKVQGRARTFCTSTCTLQLRHNYHNGVWSHQHHDCLLNRLFRHRRKKTSKLRVTGLCAVNSPMAGEFTTQRANYAENVSIWWRHHVNQYNILWYTTSNQHGNFHTRMVGKFNPQDILNW